MVLSPACVPPHSPLRGAAFRGLRDRGRKILMFLTFPGISGFQQYLPSPHPFAHPHCAIRSLSQGDAISSHFMVDDSPADNHSSEAPDDPKTPGNAETRPDFERELGVIEAITFVTRSCPSGVVVAAAERALDAIKEGGPDVIKQQAYFVLTALQGWRGDRARQVHRSLTAYLEGNLEAEQKDESEAKPGGNPTT
jgi:hypothetical protein